MKRNKIVFLIIVFLWPFSPLRCTTDPNTNDNSDSKRGEHPVTIRWHDRMLTISPKRIAPMEIQVWYIEAYVRSGSTDQAWEESTLPQRMTLLESDPVGQRLLIESVVAEDVIGRHEIRVVGDTVRFDVVFENRGSRFVDLQWMQPCVRVGEFTGQDQDDYHKKCFIFTKQGLKYLDDLPRTIKARYLGGQIYVPHGVPLEDVNPRPLSQVRPVNSLIGAISADERFIVATAWQPLQELFQGVIRCIHADPRIGGLRPGERKKVWGYFYCMNNNMSELLERYGQDFGSASTVH